MLGGESSITTLANISTLVEGDNLKGAYIHLDEASVTGTANIVMAAVMAEGETTTIYNAACEPYLQQLCQYAEQHGGEDLLASAPICLRIKWREKIGRLLITESFQI